MKKSYQAKKVRRDKIAYISLCVGLVLFIAVFAGVSFEYYRVCVDCKNQNLREYSGSYVLKREPTILSKGNKLYIYLANGDILTTVAGFWRNNEITDQALMEQYPELTFRYSDKSMLWHPVYHGIEITSVDGTICLLDSQDTMNNDIGVACFSFTMCLLTIAILITVLLCGKRLWPPKKQQ